MNLKRLIEALEENRLFCPYCGSDSVIPNEAIGFQVVGPDEFRYAVGCIQEGREFEIVYRPKTPTDRFETECPDCGSPCDYLEAPEVTFSIMKPVVEIVATVAYCDECEKDLHESYRVSGVEDHGIHR